MLLKWYDRIDCIKIGIAYTSMLCIPTIFTLSRASAGYGFVQMLKAHVL